MFQISGSFQVSFISEPTLDIPASFDNSTPTAQTILTASLSPSTNNTITEPGRCFKINYQVLLPYLCLQQFLAISLAFLFDNKYSPNIISSHKCAIEYFHMLLSIPDSNDFFLLSKMFGMIFIK